MAADRGAELLERFRRWLRDRHLPITAPRDRVAQVIFSSGEQMSVDEIAARLRESRPAVGLATIYRALDTLVESGTVVTHDFGEGFRRYEAQRTGQQHGFLVCSRCGSVTEFPLDPLDRVLALVADEHEFRADRQRVELHGNCRECRRRELNALSRVGRRR
ncbi:MAG TPA: Fur family transcriptional regulator [Gemmatimonadales bacterium]|nr:Fur family transcriptional regulator [Gemmatimonadales bacterium]